MVVVSFAVPDGRRRGGGVVGPVGVHFPVSRGRLQPHPEGVSAPPPLLLLLLCRGAAGVVLQLLGELEDDLGRHDD